METSTTKHITLKKLFTESKRVVKSQRRVFVQLSLLFLLPLSLGALLFQTLKPIIPQETNNENYFSKINILLALGAYLVSLIFTLSASASITFAAFNGFIDEPIKLKAAIKSITASFFPLLATLLLIQAILFILSFSFILLVILFMGALAQLGYASVTASNYFIIFFATAVFIATLVYFQVNFFLVNSVVVVESKWGWEAWKRSKVLINGNRRFALFFIFVFEIFYLMVFWNSSRIGSIRTSLIDGTDGVDTKSLIMSVMIILSNSCLMTMTQLYSLVITTVLYALCKESHGGEEYLSLLVKDEKVASVV